VCLQQTEKMILYEEFLLLFRLFIPHLALEPH